MPDDEDEVIAEATAKNEALVEELQIQIKTSHIPSNGDGITNMWRTYYICEVFDVQDIDLNQMFPFQALSVSTDKEKVRASIHLAKLQFQFNEACRYSELIDDEAADYHASHLHHMIRMMVHHLHYLERDKPTPPLGFH